MNVSLTRIVWICLNSTIRRTFMDCVLTSSVFKRRTMGERSNHQRGW